MLLYELLFGIHSYLIVLLVLIAIIGDYVVQYSKLHIYRALFDNFTHALIGGLSWFIVCMSFKSRYSLQTLFEIALCTLIASVIDLDHFIAARSLNLKDATNLQNRPILHCSTLSLLFTFVLILAAYCLQLRWMWRFGFILLTAFASHHTRDANRRGFWICPWGSTAPLPYFLYITLTVLIPYSVRILMQHTNFESYSGNTYVRVV